MATPAPDSQPKVLTEPPPPLTPEKEDALWKSRAQQLINENLRSAGQDVTEETTKKASRLRAFWDYLKRLFSSRREPASSTGGGGSQERSRGSSETVDADAPAEERSADKSAERQQEFSTKDIAELSVESAEKLTAHLLDLIVKDDKYREAYDKRQLPVLEMLLEKTDPKNAEKVAAEETESTRGRTSLDAAERFGRGPVGEVGNVGVSATLNSSTEDLRRATEFTQGLDSAKDPVKRSPTLASPGAPPLGPSVASHVLASHDFLARNGDFRRSNSSSGNSVASEPVSPATSRASSPAPRKKSRS
ncbi:hypothetical protein ACIP79_08070 [Streptomyces sp. NPDC088747]|uniref:hypothetical protein n=1 Tax=Streptomyces sp. NPDC088747 TaxID=3365886 RepID=UPI0038155408